MNADVIGDISPQHVIQRVIKMRVFADNLENFPPGRRPLFSELLHFFLA